MKKILCVSAGLLCLTFAGCNASREESTTQNTITVAEDVVPEEGYYLSDNDNSYIHIKDGQIELCGFDYVTELTDDWNAYDGSKISLDEYIEINTELLMTEHKLQSFTPVRFAGLGEEGSDIIILVRNYDPSVGSYRGYTFNNDKTLSLSDKNYSYCGAELPEE